MRKRKFRHIWYEYLPQVPSAPVFFVINYYQLLRENLWAGKIMKETGEEDS